MERDVSTYTVVRFKALKPLPEGAAVWRVLSIIERISLLGASLTLREEQFILFSSLHQCLNQPETQQILMERDPSGASSGFQVKSRILEIEMPDPCLLVSYDVSYPELEYFTASHAAVAADEDAPVAFVT